MWRRGVRSVAAVALRPFSTDTAVSSSSAFKGLSREERNDSGDTRRHSSGGRDTLGRRLFALTYSKRSAVIAIRKWKEEGHVVQKYELNRIVRELRRLKRYKHALEVCEWMVLQKDMRLLSGDYALHLDLIAKFRGLSFAESFFEDLPERMRDHATCSALLHAYVKYNEAEKAEALMEKMSECGFLKSPLPFNHMLSLYVSTYQVEKISDLMKKLKKTTSPDIVTYNLLFASCASQNMVEVAEEIFVEMKKAEIEPDWVTHSTLASMYIKNSLKKKAELALKEMEKKVTKKVRTAYGSLISLHTGLENQNEVQRLWKKMKSLYRKLNDLEYTTMITALLKLKQREEAEKVYHEWESVSPTKDPRIPNLLLAAYINSNEMETAEAFETHMKSKGIEPCYTTWELFTWGYSKQGQIDKAISSLKTAIRSVRKWDPDEEMVQEVFHSIEDQGNVKAAEELLETLRQEGFVNTEVYNCLLRTYAKAGKMPLIVSERMRKDGVEMNEETRKLIELTSEMCVSEIPSNLFAKR